MKKEGLRVNVDERTESIPKKVRDAQIKKYPLMLTVGDKEQNENTLAVRTLDGKVEFGVPVDKFIQRMKKNVEERKLNFE